MLKLNAFRQAIKKSLPVFAAGTGILLVTSDIHAQQVLENMIVTGSRGQPRSVSDSPVPIDVFNEEDLDSISFTDTNDILKTLVPSFSLSREPISDGGSFIRPASMRGLPTDKTLVLINSKRRHRAALVGIGGAGAQGPDIATIPSAALMGVEVLRDGAAAQYGSDAIAGVINFKLKDNDEGGSFSVDVGQFYEGDGEQVTVTGNIGFSLGYKGFLSLSGEVSDAKATSRSEQYCESFACVDPNSDLFLGGTSFDTSVFGYSEEAFIAGLDDANIGFGDVVNPWGQPNNSATRLFYNSGYELTDTMRLYSFGNYSASEADGSFFYRYPGNGTIETVRLEDGSLYSPLVEFPGGFTPRFSGDIEDISFLAGIEGEFSNNLTYDFSARFGSNEISYSLENTVNPSLGPDSPTSFKPGDLVNEELQLTADFTQFIDIGLPNEVLLAFGATFMEESYDIIQGEESSYEVGDFSSADPFGFCDVNGAATAAGAAVIANGSNLDCSDENDPVYTAVGVGSNGFPGYSPEFSGKYERDMFGLYLDGSTDVSDVLFLQAALRYEDYSDFGSETVGKVAFKYTLTDTINLRGSVGTGFRAPTPGQQGTTNVSTQVIDGLPTATGLFPASSLVGEALGAEPLDPETSTNLSFGMSGNFDNLTLTLDLYSIDLKDRFYAVSTIDVISTLPANPSAEDQEAYNNFLTLVDAGVDGAVTIGGVSYFQNAFDSKTIGMDLVATYTLGSTLLSASVNYNKTTIESDANDFLNAEDQFDIENNASDWKGTASAKHDFDNLSVLVRANMYGPYKNAIDSAAEEIQSYSSIVLFDLELNYALTSSTSLAAGARNIFDTYPEEGFNGDSCCGAVYWSGDNVSWQGGYYYARLNYNF